MRRALVAFAFSMIFVFVRPAFGYVQTMSGKGIPIRWQGSPKLNLVGNPINQSGISASEFFGSVTRGLQRWAEYSGGAVQFDYWQGTDPGHYPPNLSYNGLSSVFFASNANQHVDQLDGGILGYTQVWYNPDSGGIYEADIVLNDLNFKFSNQPTEAASGWNTVYLDNVLTHEIGHAFGLSHSGSLQDTMLFLAAPEQAHLGCDEWMGIQALYSSPQRTLTGSLSGRVLTPTGVPLFGAHVVLLSRSRGVVMGSGLTDRSGNYSIQAVEQGDYALMVEPFYAGGQVLSEYYSEIHTRVCDNLPFSRTFLTEGDGSSLTRVTVQSGTETHLDDLRVRCEAGHAAVDTRPGLSLTSAPKIAAHQGFAVVTKIDSTSSGFFQLDGLVGKVEISALDYTLYSPVAVSLKLLDQYGNEVSTQAATPVFKGVSGYVNFNGSLQADGLPLGTYYLEIDRVDNSTALYPAGYLAKDTTPFVVLTGSVSTEEPGLSAFLPHHSECRSTENFAAYHSPAGAPPRASIGGSNDKDQETGGCGTMTFIGGSPRPPAGPGAIAGWFLPWVLAGWISVRFKLRFRPRMLP